MKPSGTVIKVKGRKPRKKRRNKWNKRLVRNRSPIKTMPNKFIIQQYNFLGAVFFSSSVCALFILSHAHFEVSMHLKWKLVTFFLLCAAVIVWFSHNFSNRTWTNIISCGVKRFDDGAREQRTNDKKRTTAVTRIYEHAKCNWHHRLMLYERMCYAL